jgi:hypothetical protein
MTCGPLSRQAGPQTTRVLQSVSMIAMTDWCASIEPVTSSKLASIWISRSPALPSSSRSREDVQVSAANDAKARWKQFGPELAFLLWAVWDPIGGPPPNEYQGYALPLWKLLARDADESEVARKLGEFRTINMGFRSNPEADHETATKLQEWWGWRFECEHSPDLTFALPDLTDS